MAGLLQPPMDKGMQGMQGMEDESMPEEQGEGEQSNVTPEEQAQYTKFVDNALKLISDPKVLPGIVETLKGSEDPKMNLATAAVMVVSRVQESAEQAGQKISGDVLYHGGMEIIESLATLADAAKIHTFDQKELEGATYQALDMYREKATKEGKLDPGVLKQEFGQLVEADKQGKLGEILPGVDKAKQPEEAPAEEYENA